MAKEPPDLMPPLEQANYVLVPFRWCQIIYLFARELTRAPEATRVDWNAAISEAGDVAATMQRAGSIIVPTPWLPSPGYTDLVYWPSMVCAANAYASMDPGQRGYVRQRIAEGMPPVSILTIGAGGCDAKVLSDLEYIPEPPCLPSEAAKTGWIAAGVFVGTIGLLWGVDKLRRA